MVRWLQELWWLRLHICARVFSLRNGSLGYLRGRQRVSRLRFPPPLPLSHLTAGSRRGSAMTCYHSDRQAGRWGVFLKVSCILFVEGLRARTAGSPIKTSLQRLVLSAGRNCGIRCFRTWFLHIWSYYCMDVRGSILTPLKLCLDLDKIFSGKD